ncbi:hypothetical protein AGMMS49574_17270 [Bacteroidia bacterium]|nr:hypothetical protein AGMMS49574_17270 [Bacteroidia bacterium]
MQKHNGMRPQDVVILLKILTFSNDDWTLIDIAESLEISLGEVSGAVNNN